MAYYRDFSELVLHTTKGKDYRIDIVDRSAAVTVIAIHGGGIEPLTSELAAAIAGQEHNLYDLRGLRPTGNEVLRVPVAAFDEMRLRGLLKRSRLALSVQGMEGAEAAIYVGGRNRRLRALTVECLQAAGFAISKPSSPMPSHDPTLFFNTPADGGIQIEFTRGLRESMAGGSLACSCREEEAPQSDLFQRCVAAIRAALDQYHKEERGDLDAAMRRYEQATREVLAALKDAGRGDLN